MNADGRRPAVFLDRDGTIIEEVHYLTDPRDLRILPGAAGAIRRLRRAGFVCVVATNQSAVGRGMITEEQLGHIHNEMNRLLSDEGDGAVPDAIYFCPVAPGSDPLAESHPDRKPLPGMFLRAARDLNLDLGASWSVGDMNRDLMAGRTAGCRAGVLVLTGKGANEASGVHGPDAHVVADLAAAADLILGLNAVPRP